MARSEEIRGGEVKSFRLPALLVKQLEAAAALRQSKLSDVVRDILERKIRSFFEEYRRDRIKLLERTVAALEDDPELQDLFCNFKDEDEFPVPGSILRDSRRVRLLSAAIDAHKEMQAINRQSRELFTGEKETSEALLAELATSVKEKLGDLVRELASLVESGDLVLTRSAKKLIHFRVTPKLARLIDQRAQSLAVRRFCSLVDHNPPRLKRAGNAERGQRIYVWQDSP